MHNKSAIYDIISFFLVLLVDPFKCKRNQQIIVDKITSFFFLMTSLSEHVRLRSNSFVRSPVCLVSNPQVLTKLCSPGETINLKYVSKSLVPHLKTGILSFHSPTLQSLPRLIKVVVLKLGENGLFLVKSELLITIERCYLLSDHKQSRQYMDLYCECISSLPTLYRDDTLVDSIDRNYASRDYRLRILAANLITLVRANSRVVLPFKVLSVDKVPQVRCAVLRSLVNSTFDSQLVESLMQNAVKDNSVIVRQVAAENFGIVAPHLLDEYLELLNNKSTTEYALRSFASVVNYHDFTSLFEDFNELIPMYPKLCASALIQMSTIVSDDEHRLLFRCAKLLRYEESFITNLHVFSSPFSNKEPFLEFFNADYFCDAGITFLYAEQCLLFVPDLGTKLFGVALIFADDSSTDVQDISVSIFTEMCKYDITSGKLINKLSEGTDRQKNVLQKIKQIIKSTTGLEDVKKDMNLL